MVRFTNRPDMNLAVYRGRKTSKQQQQQPKYELPWLDYTFALATGPKVIKQFSCSTVLSMKFFLLINVNMRTITIVSILTFMSIHAQLC